MVRIQKIQKKNALGFVLTIFYMHNLRFQNRRNKWKRQLAAELEAA